MKINEIFNKKRFMFSMEVFPPKPEMDIRVVYDTIEGLKGLEPDFISVTYGAGGSTRARTVDIAATIQKNYNIPALAHLTCIGATKGSISAVLDELAAKGIKNVLALRGDMPKGENNPLKDFSHAADLVAFIKKNWDFCVGVAGYPEKHPESVSTEEDIKRLKEKVDAGADFITTQLFLDNNFYFDFVSRAQKAGIKVPVIPGIMTATSIKGIEKMAQMTGVNIPDRFRQATSSCAVDNPVCEDTARYTVGQIDHLIKNNARAVHLYTMNKVEQNRRIYFESGLKEARKQP